MELASWSHSGGSSVYPCADWCLASALGPAMFDEPTVVLYRQTPSDVTSSQGRSTPASRQPKPPTSARPQHQNSRARSHYHNHPPHKTALAPAATSILETNSVEPAVDQRKTPAAVASVKFKIQNGRLTQVIEPPTDSSLSQSEGIIQEALEDSPNTDESKDRLSPQRDTDHGSYEELSSDEDSSLVPAACRQRSASDATNNTTSRSGSTSRSTAKPVTVVLAQEPVPELNTGSLPDLAADELANSFIKAAITPRVTVTPLPTGSDLFSAAMTELSSESSSTFASTNSIAIEDEDGAVGKSGDNDEEQDSVDPNAVARSLSSQPQGDTDAEQGTAGKRQRAYSLPASILKSSEAGSRRRRSQVTRPNHVHFSQKLTNTVVYTKRTLTRVD